MKKTLLSVALAGFTLTAFANSNLYISDTTTVYLDGHLRVVGQALTTKNDKNSTSYTTEDEKTTETKVSNNLKTKILGQENRLRLGFGTSYKNADGLTFGLYTRATAYYAGEKQTIEDFTIKPFKYDKEKFKSVKPERYYFWLGSKELGTATVGKNSTVAGDNFEADSIIFGLTTGNRQPTSFERSYKWKSPKVGSFQFAYSFANSNDTSEAKYERQNAYTGTYDLGSASITGYAAWDNKYNVAGNLTTKNKTFELSAETNVVGVKLSGAVVYDKLTSYDGSVLEKVTASNVNNGYAAKASYAVNQFFKPYAGVAYSTSNDKTFDGKETSTKKVISSYVGFGSDLYKSPRVSVATFAEVGFNQTKSTIQKYNLNKLTNKEDIKSNGFGFALGGQVSF